ncbi:MAG: universal stress protein [Deltaproteobacteria bacterium]|nr:universal stress protein [Deltaproteobacteria bacterium]
MDVARKILLCIDESENAERAVHYLGRFLLGAPGYRITILSIVDEPSEDFFKDDRDREDFINKKQKKVDECLEKARRTLLDYGFDPSAIRIQTYVKECSNMAQCILDHRAQEDYGTLVLGRRGISKSEEFLFGSISNKIIHYAKNCTIWVVN